ncbi:MAG: hypothetical protein Q3998_05635 [Porphyromonas sp.]|nr:hypothetical protein [Porphyromonas sp.]
MPFIENILKQESVSIVGLEKNTGKTETLNYILRRISTMDTPIALTSIGVDGEDADRVTRTQKPEITIYEGMTFVTSEKHYQGRRLVSEILDVSDEQTALGRLITARSVLSGKCLISGPSDTAGTKRLIKRLKELNIQTTLVDGALSRMSLASPAVTDAMVLATGAALSANISQLVRQTRFVKRLIDIPAIHGKLASSLSTVDSGIWAVDESENIHDLGIRSIFLAEKSTKELFNHGNKIYVSGLVSDKFLETLRLQKKNVELIVQDFTRLFLSPNVLDAYERDGNTIRTLQQTNLIAVTINPLAPNGICLNSDLLKEEMREVLRIPVYDIKRI